MAQNVSRRKYATLIRFLTSVMQDEQQSHRSRMAAAFRLHDLLSAADIRAERAAERKYRAAQRALIPQTVEPEPDCLESVEPESAVDDVRTVLDAVLRPKED